MILISLTSLVLSAGSVPVVDPAAQLDPMAWVAEASESARRASAARPLQQGGELSLDAAVELVQRRYNAKVVRADVTTQGSARVYVLRLLSADGRVWTVRVDASTGSVSE